MKRTLDWGVFVIAGLLVVMAVPWDITGLLVMLVTAFLLAPRN